MPLLLIIILFLAILTLVTNLNINKTTSVSKEVELFKEKNKIEDKNRLVDSLSILYNNKYGDIHGNTFTSNLIRFLANQEGEENEVYLFNKNKFCVYTIPERDILEETKIKSTVEELRDIEYNKNLSCKNIEVLDSYLSDSGLELNEKEKEIIEDLKGLVSTNYYLRVDVESILEFKNLKVPVLNLFVYDITKRFLPNIQSEEKVELAKIVNNKINETKFLLNQIANGIIEKGKRII